MVYMTLFKLITTSIAIRLLTNFTYVINRNIIIKKETKDSNQHSVDV